MCLRIVFLFTVFFHVTAYSTPIKEASNFFQKEVMTSAKLSPAGKYVAAIKNINDSQNLVLIDVKTNRETTLLSLSDFSERDSSVRGLTWLDNNSIAAQFSEIKKGVEGLVDTKNSSYLIIIKLPATIGQKIEVLSVRTSGWLVEPLRNQTNKFLYAKSGIYSKIYELNISKLAKHKQKRSKLQKIDGGQFKKSNEVASIDGYAVRWFFEDNHHPAAVLKYIENGDLVLDTINDEQAEEGKSEDKSEDEKLSALKTWSSESLNGNFKGENEEENVSRTLILPIAQADEKDSFYCLDFFEDEERSVYKVNYATGEQELVFEADSYSIVDLILSYPENKLIGVQVLRNGSLHNVHLNSVGEKNTESENKNPSKIKSLIGISKDRKISLFYTETHNQPGQFLLSNNKNNKESLVGSAYPHLAGKLNSYLTEGVILQNDLEIPYLLTLPEKPSGKPFPLIVMPHGGPIGVFDHRYFDLTTQYLAINGYAVLRVNFRGSSGQTIALKEAGKKQWGKEMLTDIHQATLKVSSLKEIDQNKICIFGMSYGGYAAAMLTMLHPQTYSCAVDVAGVSDLNLYLNAPNRTDLQEKWLLEQVGDPVSEYDSLKAISPIYLASKLEQPILIMHGAEDEVVDVEHSYRLKLILEKYNKKFNWHIFPEGKHGFDKIESTIELFSKALEFIDTELK